MRRQSLLAACAQVRQAGWNAGCGPDVDSASLPFWRLAPSRQLLVGPSSQQAGRYADWTEALGMPTTTPRCLQCALRSGRSLDRMSTPTGKLPMSNSSVEAKVHKAALR